MESLALLDKSSSVDIPIGIDLGGVEDHANNTFKKCFRILNKRFTIIHLAQ